MSDLTIECHRRGKAEWDRELRKFDDANYLQSWRYGIACWGERFLEHFVMKERGVTIGAAQVLVLQVPLLRRGLAYVKWGPLWQPSFRSSHPDDFLKLVHHLRDFYVVQRGLFLRLAPWEFTDQDVPRALETAGFRSSNAPLRATALVNLHHPLDRLRASLTRHWRQNLKTAERNGLEVEGGTSAELLNEFVKLHKEMRARKPGWIESMGSFPRAYRAMEEDMKPHISICRHHGKPVAGLIVSAMGKRAVAVYAATGNGGLNLRGSYLLQWRTVERLHAQGIHFYDLGGINGQTHPGPTQFKLGLMGKLGRQADYVGEFHASERWSSEVIVHALDAARASFKAFRKGWRQRQQSVKRRIASTAVDQHPRAESLPDPAAGGWPVAKPSTFVSVQAGAVEILDQIAEEWRTLCSSGPYHLPFYQPEWIVATIRAFYPGARVLLITIREGDCLKAVLPLLELKRSAGLFTYRELRSATNVEHSGRFDLICAADADGQQLASHAWSFLEKIPNWDVITLTNVPERAALENVLSAALNSKCRVLQQQLARSPLVRLQCRSAKDDLAQFARSHKLRENLRRNWRKLQALGQITLKRIANADAEGLRTFFELERNGWKGRRGTAIACAPATRCFYESIARAADQRGYFSLYFLELAGRAIAARFGFVMGERYVPVKIAYDEAFSQYAPGHVVVGLSLCDVARRGVTECDWLGRQSDWKLQWTTEARTHTNCYIFRNSARGRLLCASVKARYWLATQLRRFRRAVMAHLRGWRARRRSYRAAKATPETTSS